MEVQESELKQKEEQIMKQLSDVTNQLKDLARRKRQIQNEIRVAKGMLYFPFAIITYFNLDLTGVLIRTFLDITLLNIRKHNKITHKI